MAIATNTSPRASSCSGHVTARRIGELRQDGGEEHGRLRIRQPDDEPLAQDPPPAFRRDRPTECRGKRAAVTEGPDPEPDEVDGARKLDRREERRRALDQHADSERDRDHLDVDPGAVARARSRAPRVARGRPRG